MKYHIEKRLELNVPIAKVWDALVDYKKFGEWFRVKLEAPFALGKVARGKITHPGYEHVIWEATVQSIEKEKLFSFTWHPYAIDPNVDYSKEPPTLVEFKLERKGDGTLLILSESGFDKIPEHRRLEALRMNDEGWTEQMKNMRRSLPKLRSSLIQRTKAHADLFAALGDPTRLLLVEQLSDGRPKSISQLTDKFELSRQAITKHLVVLENVGIVRSIREGRENIFAFEVEAVERLQTYLNRVSQQWDSALSRLQLFLQSN